MPTDTETIFNSRVYIYNFGFGIYIKNNCDSSCRVADSVQPEAIWWNIFPKYLAIHSKDIKKLMIQEVNDKY